MKRVKMAGVFIAGLCFASLSAAAEQGHDHGAHSGQEMHQEAVPAPSLGEQTLTGEVIDAFCYLSHPEQGQGSDHASCAKKCIEGGLPVAIKVGDQLYLATMNDHQPANKVLGPRAGHQVTVHGKVLERDGQRLIAISHVD